MENISEEIYSLAAESIELLRAKNLRVATAESCTGGTLAGALTDVPGSSDVFGYGVVSYANEAKMRLLAVREETLAAHGAVSAETACEMALGALRLSGADFALSTTGIAGPGGAVPGKKVGTVYCALADKKGDRPHAFLLSLDGSRAEIRAQTVRAVLLALRDRVKQIPDI